MFRKLRGYSQCHQQPAVFLSPRSGVNPHTAPHHTTQSVHMTPLLFLRSHIVTPIDFSLNFPDTSLEKGLWKVMKDRPVASMGKAVSRTNQSKKSKQAKEQKEGQAIGGKDASLFLFRALGKILHCKRESYHLVSSVLFLVESLQLCRHSPRLVIKLFIVLFASDTYKQNT